MFVTLIKNSKAFGLASFNFPVINKYKRRQNTTTVSYLDAMDLNKYSKQELVDALCSKEEPIEHLSGPEDTLKPLGKFRNDRVEHFWGIYLNGAHEIICVKEIGKGSMNRCIVHPIPFIRPALLNMASAVIAVHNHPSGRMDPSKEDIELTKRLKSACDIMGVGLLDHIIISKKGFYSFASNELL